MKSLKLLVQIPCLNEEDVLPATLKDIPREIEGVSTVEVLVIDDGSTDRTAEIAKANGVDHVLQFQTHKGLAQAFAAGLDYALRLGADIIVNTDADNQYKGSGIPNLIKPVLEGRADMVIGCRPIEHVKQFSILKKLLQRFGSSVVSGLAQVKIPDVTSGFRAYNREAAIRLNVLSEFTYTLETVMQVGTEKMAVACVDVEVNAVERPSRLFAGIPDYLKRQSASFLRIYSMFKPLKVFVSLGAFIFALGLLLGLRFLWLWLLGNSIGHVQSLILTATLLIMGFQICLIGLVADLISANRRLLQDVLYRTKKLELNQK